MTSEDETAWQETLTELRKCRALDPDVLGVVAAELAMAASAAVVERPPTDRSKLNVSPERAKVYLLGARLLYVLQHEDGRGL